MRQQNQLFERRLLLLDDSVTNKNLDGLPKNLQQELNQDTSIQVVQFKRNIKYDYFSYDQIVQQILPSNTPVPHIFDKFGKIGIFNFSEIYEPYQNQIAQVYLDKHKSVSTILKIIFNQSGETQYKLLISKIHPIDLNISVSEGAVQAEFSIQHFTFSSRMQTQRERFVSQPIKEFIEVGSQFPIISLQLAKRGIMSTVFYTGEDNQRREVIKQNAIKNHLSNLLNVIEQDGGDFNNFFEEQVKNKNTFSDVLLTNHCFGLAFFLEILSIFGEYIMKNEEDSQWKPNQMPIVHFYIQQSAVRSQIQLNEPILSPQKVYEFATKSIEQRIQTVAGERSQLVIQNFKQINQQCNKQKLNFVESETNNLFYLGLRIPHFTTKMDNRSEKSSKSAKRMDKNHNIWTSSLGSYHLNFGEEQPKKVSKKNAFLSMNRQESVKFSSSLQNEDIGAESWSIQEMASNWKNNNLVANQNDEDGLQTVQKKKAELVPGLQKKKKITFGQSLQGMMNLN